MDFVDQRTRSLMVEWCDWALQERPVQTSYGDAQLTLTIPHRWIYIEYAILKKWLSADGQRVTAAGWGTAARFLKR